MPRPSKYNALSSNLHFQYKTKLVLCIPRVTAPSNTVKKQNRNPPSTSKTHPHQTQIRKQDWFLPSLSKHSHQTSLLSQLNLTIITIKKTGILHPQTNWSLPSQTQIKNNNLVNTENKTGFLHPLKKNYKYQSINQLASTPSTEKKSLLHLLVSSILFKSKSDRLHCRAQTEFRIRLREHFMYSALELVEVEPTNYITS